MCLANAHVHGDGQMIRSMYYNSNRPSDLKITGEWKKSPPESGDASEHSP